MNLLITKAFDCDDYEQSQLKEIGYNIDVFDDERQKVLHPEKYDAVICNQLFLYNNIKDFKNLKAIQLTSAGFDRISMDYCAENHIKVFNAKGVYSIPMAEWCVLKILEIYKNSFILYENQKNKHWIKERKLLELTDKNVLIIGIGSVGLEIAKRLHAFGCNITGLDICEIQSPFFKNIFLMDKLDEMLPVSDIVILSLPLLNETKHLLNNNKFSKMKDDSVLINVSRGGIICERDLIFQLEKGKFRGVALDVFENEPLSPDSPLWNFNNVIITPHNSFVSEKAKIRLFNIINKNLKGLI